MKTEEQIYKELKEMEERASSLSRYAYNLENGSVDYEETLVEIAPWCPPFFYPTKEDIIAECREEARRLKDKVAALGWVLGYVNKDE